MNLNINMTCSLNHFSNFSTKTKQAYSAMLICKTALLIAILFVSARIGTDIYFSDIGCNWGYVIYWNSFGVHTFLCTYCCFYFVL